MVCFSSEGVAQHSFTGNVHHPLHKLIIDRLFYVDSRASAAALPYVEEQTKG